ncbi:5-bromo-4-chloroindolyl phosphate hydrolysis family protein [Anoxybacillus flavithermus]|uniref:5-bromo-4-chloroindolyl phosphate hydrolysis protein n=1 Tax=Anoxybacillus flavithermus AK1 TaxID=1297581 RepID=M8CYG2_9BACL|nr:5-bromo-4-chloroindolyl phosphate hydrolysis family protein [Anoxybacillus flavithermus]EMT46518.1 5-bromo-4-chloroindolyl phosphate hydrolysis protein [Anoxybacillus flavithermus AK1]
MKRFIRTIWRWFVSWNVGLFSALISLLAFRLPFPVSFLIGASIGVMYSIYMKKKEKKHVSHRSKDERLKDAKKKVRKIGQSLWRIRSISMFSKLSRLYSICQKMVEIVEKQPDRLAVAQPFFNTTLDSIVTIIDKYIYLMKQPVKNDDIRQAISEAEQALDLALTKAENQLLDMLEEDLFDLQTEVKLVKHTIATEESLSLPTKHTVTMMEEKKHEQKR